MLTELGAIKFVAEELEGSEYTEDPNPTMDGIEQAEYDTLRDSQKKPRQSVANISQQEYTEIYSRRYWGPMHCGLLPPAVALALFQFGVNAGNGTAVKALQDLVGADPDGKMGPETLDLVNANKSPADLASQLLDAQGDYYDRLLVANPERNQPYIDGWHNRILKTRIFLSTGLNPGQAAGTGAGLILIILVFFILALKRLGRG